MTTGRAAPRWPLHPALVFALLFSALFALHAPLLRLPYFWDEAGYYVPAAHDLLLHGSLIPQETVSNAHPPLVMAWLALWWKISAFTPAVTRTAMLLVAAFALLGLFRLALVVSNAAVATATVACTALYSVFFMQSSLAHVDVAAAAFTLWALSYYVEDRRWMCALMFSLAALSKETAIIAPLALLMWAWVATFLNLRSGLGVALPTRRSVALPVPLLPLVLWFAYHYAKTGYVFGNPEFVRYNVTATLDPLRFLLAAVQRLWQAFGHMNLFVLTAATAVAMLLPPQPKRERIAIPHQLTFAVVIAAYVAALALVGGAVLARYMLPVVPLVILVCVSTLWRRVRGWQVAVAAVCATFVAAWFVAPPYRIAPEDNLAYRDFIQLHAKAEALLAQRYPGARVLTAWPASDELTKPYLGYVKKPLSVVRLENFTLEQIQLAQTASFASRSPYDVALLFSTKYEPAKLVRWGFWERQQKRFFDYHQDVPPQFAAQMLGGNIVFEEHRGAEWVAVVEFKRARDVRLLPLR
ncbi:MAG: glycosyltransferase [Candidatus Koribacter versatilis]|uniref:Glycosyltransferase n=1 Tax=Candidatus Korobacter versatilis TaxID=658062 RepID=A0A932EN11_9BACT|nr:glycosyltransferase [Candidatus Koribacter versatilis]